MVAGLPVHSLSPLLAGHKEQHRGAEALGYELAQAQQLAPLPPHKHEPLSHGGGEGVSGAHSEPEGGLQHIAGQLLHPLWQSGTEQSPHLHACACLVISSSDQANLSHQQ